MFEPATCTVLSVRCYAVGTLPLFQGRIVLVEEDFSPTGFHFFLHLSFRSLKPHRPSAPQSFFPSLFPHCRLTSHSVSTLFVVEFADRTPFPSLSFRLKR